MQSKNGEHFEPELLGPLLATSLRKALVVLLLPVLEFALLRILVKQGLGLKLGWRYFTDFDFIFPLPIALSIAFFVLEQRSPLKIEFRKKAFAGNVAIVLGFVICVSFFEKIALFSPWLAALLFSFGGLAVVVTAFRTFLRLGDLASHPHRWVVLPALLIASSSILGTLFFQSFWPYFSALASAGSCFVLEGALGEVDCFTTAIHGARMIIRHPALTIAVGQGCGGIDGFFLFAFLLLIVALVAPKSFTRQQWWWVALGGVPVIFGLNILRICGFFAFAILFKDVLGSQRSVDVMLALFHTHAGWVVFCAGILSYLRVMKGLFSESRASLLPTALES